MKKVRLKISVNVIFSLWRNFKHNLSARTRLAHQFNFIFGEIRIVYILDGYKDDPRREFADMSAGLSHFCYD